jgi:hypothetical protein
MGPDDLTINLVDDDGHPKDPYEITYALYDVTEGVDVIIGDSERDPVRKEIGLFYAHFQIPEDANLGLYRIRWRFREESGGPLHEVMEEFEVKPEEAFQQEKYGQDVASMIGRMRRTLRDNDPDRNYRFRPPTSSGTVNEFNQAFGYIWEDDELVEYMERALDTVNLYPPETYLRSISDVVQNRPAWRQMLIMGGVQHAAMALTFNWAAEEFSVAGDEKVTVYAEGEEFDIEIETLHSLWKEASSEETTSH